MNLYKIVMSGRNRGPQLFAAVMLAGPLLAPAADAPAVDTSHWACKFCPFEQGLSGSVELGAGYVSDDSAKFGEYNGLDKQGGFAIANAGARYRRRDGSWLDLTLADLGLDTRSVGIAGGRQGSYTLSLNYRELQHAITASAVTPFLGAGTGTLSLPAGWIRGSTTGSMPALSGSLQRAELGTQRKQLDFGASMTRDVRWQFAVRYRHETKTGALGSAGTFAFNSSQLVMPVDYDTDQIDASAAFSGRRLNVRLAYYGSKFANNERSLTWSNPYLSSVAGATAGQLAAAPDNQFHQLVMSAGWQLDARTTAKAEVALGRLRQDEAFLPPTLNSSLTTLPLPRSSLDGRVNTVSANLRVSSAVTDRLRVDAAATYDDRDNRTAQATYGWVTTDSFVAQPRINLPYGSTRTQYQVDAGYRAGNFSLGRYQLAHNLRLNAGYDYDIRKRDLQEINETREGRYWGKVSLRLVDRLDFVVKGAHSRRTVSPYAANPTIVSPENPLMRKYNMADRARDNVEFRLDFALNSRSNLGLSGDFGWDDYRKSTLGLLEAQDSTWTADAAVMVTDRTSASVYLNHQQIKSRQANAQLLAPAPTWYASNLDRIDTGGANLRHRASDKLDLGASYMVARSTGKTDIRGALSAFPELFSRLDSVKLYGDYRPRKRLSLHLAYWYERYRSANWMVDDVAVNTIPNVISLAQGAPVYHVNVVTLSGSYQFH
jgi:MtrB/PioB family decaheme-associated outer membrane protein